MSLCVNSIGSSIVRMFLGLRLLIQSIIAASVVDLPEPVVPVTRIRPRSSSAMSASTDGSRSSSKLGMVWNRPARDGDGVALHEGVGAHAPAAGRAEREVEGARLLELREPRGIPKDAAQQVRRRPSRSSGP